MPAPDRMGVDKAIVNRALAFVAEFHGDDRCSLNCIHAEALAAEVLRLRAEADAREEAAKERGIRWAYMNDIGTAKTVTDAVARWRQAQGRTGVE